MTHSLDLLTSLLSSAAILPVIIAAGLLILERYWQIPERLQPILFIRLLGVRLAAKTNINGQDTKQQLVISGTVGFLLLTLPWLIIAYIMNMFAYYPTFFDAFILLMCIQFSGHITRIKRISLALKKGKKQLAKDTLAKMTLRDTQTLSSIGICKAATESLLLRAYYQQFTVIFWFVLSGPFIALFYRMALELNHAWNPKLSRFKHFGIAAGYACHWIQWLPIRIVALLSIVTSRGITPFVNGECKRLFKATFSSNGTLLLASQSITTKLHLSGAVMYEGLKFRREKFKGLKEPEVVDLPTVIKVLNRTSIGFISFLFILSSLINALVASMV
ncbi:cobalamin biosynthesis protein [Glaciecola sp. KUL10]|uniref:cobalamin biosynthesis protein CobD/CbiB n=1 Tax=Glaciecola sp. (strain KUL10) TaxID=2161813 RepID=UPI001314DFB5|nr:cobalamin biosynthesis protein [Glaciecola sp. KUL10]